MGPHVELQLQTKYIQKLKFTPQTLSHPPQSIVRFDTLVMRSFYAHCGNENLKKETKVTITEQNSEFTFPLILKCLLNCVQLKAGQ